MANRELDKIRELVAAVKQGGAEQCDAYYEWGREATVTARDQAIEKAKQSVSTGVGVRVIKGGRLGFGYTSDLSKASLERLAQTALALADETASDANNGLPNKALVKPVKGQPDCYDEAVAAISNDDLLAAALELEKVGVGVDPRVTNTEDVGAGVYESRVAMVTSDGFEGNYQKTYAWRYAVLVGEKDGEKQSGYFSDYATHMDGLMPCEAIAREAVRRTARMLGAKKIESAELPVILEPTMTKSFIRGIIGAINGDMIYKKSSFLLDKLGEQIASPLFTLVDDGTLDRRTGSCPFDGEGLATQRQLLVEKGVLSRYLYDTYTANKAGAKPTGTAGRGYSSMPHIGTTNIMLEPGDETPAELMKGIERGLLVTGMMGRGANVVNGEYSRGASGLLIENGEVTRPVQEITVAGNMLEMLADIDAVGNDLDWRGSTGAPSIRFAKLTVSGK